MSTSKRMFRSCFECDCKLVASTCSSMAYNSGMLYMKIDDANTCNFDRFIFIHLYVQVCHGTHGHILEFNWNDRLAMCFVVVRVTLCFFPLWWAIWFILGKSLIIFMEPWNTNGNNMTLSQSNRFKPFSLIFPWWTESLVVCMKFEAFNTFYKTLLLFSGVKWFPCVSRRKMNSSWNEIALSNGIKPNWIELNYSSSRTTHI